MYNIPRIATETCYYIRLCDPSTSITKQALQEEFRVRSLYFVFFLKKRKGNFFIFRRDWNVENIYVFIHFVAIESSRVDNEVASRRDSMGKKKITAG
jgi:hypothetical protein